MKNELFIQEQIEPIIDRILNENISLAFNYSQFCSEVLPFNNERKF